MIVSIHQPHFLPWMGYINKIMKSDAFILLNTVQYRPRYYQNRAKIRRNGEAIWISVPVHSERETKIQDVTIAQDQNWQKSITSNIEHLYRKKPFFNDYWAPIRNAITKEATTLDILNFNILKVLLEILNIDHVKLYVASDLPVTTTNPTQRLVDLCTTLGATDYISGRGGRDYMEVDKFSSANINIIYQDLDFNNVIYSQGEEPFIPGLSVIDALFNIGPQETRKLSENAWNP